MPSQSDGPPTLAVIRGVRNLGDRGEWPTAQEVADHLELPLADVRAALKVLHHKRIFKPRQRRGRCVWTPWEGH